MLPFAEIAFSRTAGSRFVMLPSQYSRSWKQFGLIEPMWTPNSFARWLTPS
jgi:hypothetical protein